jgi:glycosyltransferase involved in cell wall biosynthesis
MSAPRQTGGRPTVLFLTQVLPYPLDAGPKVRAYQLLRWLAERAEVVLASFLRPDDPVEALDHLRSVCTEVHTVGLHRSRVRDGLCLGRSVVTGRPFLVTRDDVAAMHRLVAELARRCQPAVVHADQLGMAQYAGDLAVPARVLDEHNAVYRLLERLADHEPSPLRRALLRREARLVARYELAQLAAFDRVLFVSEVDRRALTAARRNGDRRPGACSAVLPICVDAAAMAPLAVRPDARRVTVLGTMFWPPNADGVRWFAAEAWPHVLRRVPDAVLTVIGKHPPAAVRRLTERFGRSVEVTGYLAEPAPYLVETGVFAVPLRSGGGMRVKILDAWAWGLPVVTTTVGAEGIDYLPGRDLLVADTPAELARATAALLLDAPRRRRIAAAGRAQLERHYDWRRAEATLDRLYGPLLVASAGRP